MVLGQNLEILSFFVFQQNRPKQSGLGLSRSKTSHFRLEKIDLKSRKIAFFQRGKSMIFGPDLGSFSFSVFQ